MTCSTTVTASAAIAALARHLNDTSMLLLDVRDADRTRLRCAGGLTGRRAPPT
jgi:hypothetical protein